MALSLYDLNVGKADSTALSTEISTRASADTVISAALSTEVSTRTSADTVISTSLSTTSRLASGSVNGLMASGDFTKLAGLSSTTPTATDITVTDIADNTRINLGNNITNLQLLTDTVNNLGVMTAVKSSIDGFNVYTVITYNRVNSIHGTTAKFMTSTLSGGTAPNYTTRTEVYYDTNGTTVLATKVYTIVYDGNGIVLSETCA